MGRVLSRLRLPVLLILAVVLGCLVELRPRVISLTLPDRKGTVAVPSSPEGWVLEPGEGDYLAMGHTRFHVMELEIERTYMAQYRDISEYIDYRHGQAWKHRASYDIQLRGEFTKIGSYWMPTSRATYDETVLGRKVRMVQFDSYWMLEGRYVRVGFRFPQMFERYFWYDQAFVVTHLKLAQ